MFIYKITYSYKSSPTIKYSDAYRLYITLYPLNIIKKIYRYSINEHNDSLRDIHLRTNSPSNVVRYFTVI